MTTSPTDVLPTRPEALSALREAGSYDVIIIGAGINGVGLFRELCLQGVKTLIIDRKDFCAGASSAPSRLIHGGIKYLETGEFRLVAQSTLERNLLLRNAPHYVTPLPTVLPIHSWFGGILPSLKRFLKLKAKMTDRGVFVIELGLQIYDFLGRRARVMPRHELRVGRAAHARWPSMDPKIVATGLYYDAAISQPERLGMEIVKDGLAAEPKSNAVTYMVAKSLNANQIELRDTETSERFTVKANLVVNAGGAWIDRINHDLGLDTHYIGGTQGSHLVLRHPELLRELDGHMVYFGTPDGRICLAYPFFGNILIGSTDIRNDNPDEALCSDTEQDYMLSMLSGLFPKMRFGADDVLYRYCGVRPLPATNADDPGAISRDHIIHTDRAGLLPVLSLVGGKWTTFRGLAEEVGDIALHHLGKARRCSTRKIAIGGGKGFPESQTALKLYTANLAASFGIDTARAGALVSRYGTAGQSVAAYCAKDADRALDTLADYTRREIAYIATHEMTVHLSDLLYRRTSIALSGRLTRAVVEEIAGIIGPLLGWSAQQRALECCDSWAEAVEAHRVPLSPEPVTV